MIEIPKHIQSLKPYVPGKPISELKREKGLKKIVKLASNENLLGPSPKAVKAIERHLSEAHIYPDASAYELVHALAKTHLKFPENFICGNGIDSLLGYIVTTFTKMGDEILTAQGSFIGMTVNTKKLNRILKQIPLTNYAINLAEIQKQISSKTKIIYLANPNNPTGTMFSYEAFENFMEGVPKHILVILDEAYFSFASKHPTYPNGLDYEYENLLVTRTFSKDYGLAGLRVGYASGPKKLISELYKVKLPFEPGSLAQVAAIAALEDTRFVEKSVKLSQQSLIRFMTHFRKLKIKFISPSANFIMMIMPTEAVAKAFHRECLNQGLILRHLASFGIPEGIRINSGTDAETAFACKIIERVYKKLL